MYVLRSSVIAKARKEKERVFFLFLNKYKKQIQSLIGLGALSVFEIIASTTLYYTSLYSASFTTALFVRFSDEKQKTFSRRYCTINSSDMKNIDRACVVASNTH